MIRSRLDKIVENCMDQVAPSKTLVPAVLTGGPGHRGRAIILLFSSSSGYPDFVVKIAFTAKESEYIHQEFNALEAVHSALPHYLTNRIPEPLALMEFEGQAALVSKAFKGRRFLVPKLTSKRSVLGPRVVRGFFQQAFSFSKDLGREGVSTSSLPSGPFPDVVTEFRQRFGGQGEISRELHAFEREILAARISCKPAWQHCDLMMSNVVEDEREMKILDWEHSRPYSQPWFDIAYAPIALALMASWQAGKQLRQVAGQVLDSKSWTGRVLCEEMNRVWSFPLPLSWGVLLTAMETAIRQQVGGRTASDEWSDFVHIVLSRSGKQQLGWLSRW